MIGVKVSVVRAGAAVPRYMSAGAAGCDVTACLAGTMEILPGERAAVPTGLAFEIPAGYEIQVRPRSGLAIRHGVTVVNSPGTIDSDYRGEVMVLLTNLGRDPFTIASGDRIAQLVLQKVEQIRWEATESLTSSERGIGGFGSTGLST